MRQTVIFFYFLLIGLNGFTQSYSEELENSFERSKGGSGVDISYRVHVTQKLIKVYQAEDFDTGVMIKSGDKPLYFELTKKEGEEKEVIVISLETIKFVQFKVVYPKGECHYVFDFYY